MKAVVFATLLSAAAAQNATAAANATNSTGTGTVIPGTVIPPTNAPSTARPSTIAPTLAPTATPEGGCDRPLNSTLDATIAAFALNLEYLEAEFYSWAAYGKGIPECKGVSTGGQKANLSDAVQAYAEEIAINEIAHVKFLRKVLGDKAPDCPTLDVGPAFGAAANAALNTTLTPTWNAYSFDETFLLGAFIFEDVGVTAYNGANPLFTNKVFTGASASILAVEAYHAATVRTLLTLQKDVPMRPYNGPTIGEVAGNITALRAMVGGGKEVNISTQAYNTTENPVPPTSIVPADADALAFARTTTEVEAIVFLGGSGKGGFFPNGLNSLKA